MIPWTRKHLAGWAAALSALAAWAGGGTAQAQAVAACPASLPAQTRCYDGQDANGAFYWIAIPATWNGALVVHAHGGPRTGAPKIDDPVEDLERFSVLVKEGYAWAGSTYRRGGYGVRMAAEDTDNLRKLVWARFGRPKLTILHGQSWGGNVAAKAAELYAIDADGRRNYDGVALTSGVIAGGTRAYGFRADLRAVYQYYCHNHPAPDEPQYPLWQGLPKGATMSRKALEARVNACTGLDLSPEKRTADQARNLKNILAVTGIREDQLVAHLHWATTLFQDMVQARLGGHNPFGNVGVRYSGSDDDAALNRGVERFTADPAGVALLAYDSDLSGLIPLPTVTIHAKGDPTAFVGHEALYRDVVARAGRSDLLVQTFTDERVHSKLSDAEYAALFEALRHWIETGARPTPQAIAERCQTKALAYPEACHFDLAFTPTPASR